MRLMWRLYFITRRLPKRLRYKLFDHIPSLFDVYIENAEVQSKFEKQTLKND